MNNKNTNQDQKKKTKRIHLKNKRNFSVYKKIINDSSMFSIISLSLSFISIILSLCVFYFWKSSLPIENKTTTNKIEAIEEEIKTINTFINYTLNSKLQEIQNDLRAKQVALEDTERELARVESKLDNIKNNVVALDSPKKNLMYLRMIKEIDGWKILSNEFQNVEFSLDEKTVCIKKGNNTYCLRKDEEEKRYFVKCKSEDCSVSGKSYPSQCDSMICIGYKSHLIYEIGYYSFISDKESEYEKTTITFSSEDKKNIYGKIIISGQGKSLKEATQVEIFNYNGFMEIENLILIAVRNLAKYENNRGTRQFINFVGNFVFKAIKIFKKSK